MSMMASMSHGVPWIWTGRSALVRGVMRASIRLGSMLYVAGSMSTKTGIAPLWRMA
jgi:hypothetical protein